MPEDIFDIVDERDQVIGQERRSVIHAEKRLHRAIHILLRNDAGQFFLQKRAPSKDKNPNRWDSSCSGHVDAGEVYDQAAVRELEEELGVRVPINELEKIRKFEASKETGMEFVWVYFGHHNGPFHLNVVEISDGRFWDRSEIEAAIRANRHEFSGAFCFIWESLRERLT